MNLFNRIRGQVAVIITLVAVALCGFVTGQVTSLLPTPTAWVDNTGTNYFGINGSAVPYVQLGTNVYAGLTVTTNFTHNGATNSFVFKNGVLTAIQ